MKLRKNLKILKAGIHQAYGLKNAQFYDVQAKIMRKYIAFGWSVHEWLLRSKHALRNHLAVVEELVPTISGVTRRKLEGIFSPENEFSLNWAENMYEILKREVPDYQNLSYKEFMKIADLSMVDCENPPKPKKIKPAEAIKQEYCDKGADCIVTEQEEHMMPTIQNTNVSPSTYENIKLSAPQKEDIKEAMDIVEKSAILEFAKNTLARINQIKSDPSIDNMEEYLTDIAKKFNDIRNRVEEKLNIKLPVQEQPVSNANVIRLSNEKVETAEKLAGRMATLGLCGNSCTDIKFQIDEILKMPDDAVETLRKVVLDYEKPTFGDLFRRTKY
jgi:hypothetical protein